MLNTSNNSTYKVELAEGSERLSGERVYLVASGVGHRRWRFRCGVTSKGGSAVADCGAGRFGTGLSRLFGRIESLTVHDPANIVMNLAISLAIGKVLACRVDMCGDLAAVLRFACVRRPQPGIRRYPTDPTPHAVHRIHAAKATPISERIARCRCRVALRSRGTVHRSLQPRRDPTGMTTVLA